MARTGEHKTDQARIIAYAEEIGWTYVPREEAERRRGFNPNYKNAESVLAGVLQRHGLEGIWKRWTP